MRPLQAMRQKYCDTPAVNTPPKPPPLRVMKEPGFFNSFIKLFKK